jgi:hypothetical protein
MFGGGLRRASQLHTLPPFFLSQATDHGEHVTFDSSIALVQIAHSLGQRRLNLAIARSSTRIVASSAAH